MPSLGDMGGRRHLEGIQKTYSPSRYLFWNFRTNGIVEKSCLGIGSTTARRSGMQVSRYHLRTNPDWSMRAVDWIGGEKEKRSNGVQFILPPRKIAASPSLGPGIGLADF